MKFLYLVPLRWKAISTLALGLKCKRFLLLLLLLILILLLFKKLANKRPVLAS